MITLNLISNFAVIMGLANYYNYLMLIAMEVNKLHQ